MKLKCFWGLLFWMSLTIHPSLAQEFLLEPIEPQEPVLQLAYSWGDFLMSERCLPDFNQLNALPFLSEQQNQLKEKMQTYCIGKITVWNTLTTLFRQNKKALLIDKTLKENGLFWGYVKAFPFYLFDIHHTAPTGNDLLAKLDKIQNALQNKNPEAVAFLMQDLSPNEQLFFMPLFNEVSNLIDFKKLLLKSEENHD